MNTYEEIRNELLDRASSSGIEGVTVDGLCSLLAYSIYKNQMLQAQLDLESSFSTSSQLNSRIHHSANLLYSVFRGRCPYITVRNVQSIERISAAYLDSAFTYGGYYFYYRDNVEFSVEQRIDNIEYICSANRVRECTLQGDAVSDSFFYLDFLDENISEDLILRGYEGASDEGTILTYTTSASDFYKKNVSEDRYEYEYLLITIPSYGVRLMRHSDRTSWGYTRFSLSYLPYSETYPEFDNLRSISSLQFQIADNGENLTTIDVHPAQERLEDLDQIYARAVDSYYAQNTLATVQDLESMLNSEAPASYFKVYNDTVFQEAEMESEGKEYTLEFDPNVATVVYSNLTGRSQADLQADIDDWRTTMNVSVDIRLAPAMASPQYHVHVEAYSPSKILDNETLNALCLSYESRIGQEFSHSDLEADIIRLGYTRVKTYLLYKIGSSGNLEYHEWTDTKVTNALDKSGGEVQTGKISCLQWQYPNIKAEVKLDNE